MGEVYRARDSVLGRDVAIKILPTEFAADSERFARFEREARLLAALNHPHIGAIYGFERFGDTRGLILELVDGETLAERLSRGPLSVSEALGIAAEICQALDAAHEARHRSSRPEAGQHQAQHARGRQGAGFRARAREGRREHARPVAVADAHARDARRRDPRHGGLHEPRAGARPAGGQAHGRLGVRLRAVRDAERPCQLRSRHAVRHDRGRARARAGLGAAAGDDARWRSGACSRGAWRRTPGVGSGTSATPSPT